jgi:hypothetical protein
MIEYLFIFYPIVINCNCLSVIKFSCTNWRIGSNLIKETGRIENCFQFSSILNLQLLFFDLVVIILDPKWNRIELRNDVTSCWTVKLWPGQRRDRCKWDHLKKVTHVTRSGALGRQSLFWSRAIFHIIFMCTSGFFPKA